MSDEGPELPALPRFRSGDRVSGYAIEAQIGDGSKHVYCAREVASARPVALKIVPVRSMQGVPPPERTNGINHVVTTYAAGIDDAWRVGFVAMELVRGPNLADCIEDMVARNRRPTAAARRRCVALMLQVAGGLHELHRRGLVHCDVKPHNIVIGSGAVDDAERAVLVDLGIARHSGVPAVQSTLMHVAAYSAPEQLLGQRIDARTDVFAFGVTMHDVLLARSARQRGVRPTLGLERLDRIDPSIDADLAAIVAECTSLPPPHRYADMREVVADLERWLAGQRPRVRPWSPWRRFTRFAVRRPRAAMIGTLVLFGVVLTTSFATTTLAGVVDQQRQRQTFEAAIALGDLDGAASLAGRSARLGTAAAAPDAMREVINLLHSGDAAAARRHAARWCSRDGFVAHTGFDLWFARLLRSDDLRVRSDAARLVARALYDRPRRAGEPLPAVADVLLMLAREEAGDAGLFAVTALGGLADFAIGDRLLQAAVRQSTQHTNGREFLRLCVEALHRLAFEARSHPVTGDDIAHTEQQLRDCMQLLRDGPELGSCAELARPTTTSWFRMIRCWRDEASLPAPDATPLLAVWPGDRHARSLARSREFLDELVAGRWGEATTAFELGVFVEHGRLRVDDVTLIEAAMARDARLAAGLERGDFAAGRASVVAAWTGGQNPWQVDDGARLADELAPPAAMQPVTSAADSEPAADRAIAVFDFRTQPVRLAGSALAVSGSSVRLAWDESQPPCGFGWLGTAGRSSFELEFVEPPRTNSEMVVWVQEQKGTRGAFPLGGEAGLDLFVDGVLHASWRDLGGLGERAIPLVMTGIEPGRHRRLALRLRADSNTTIRLFSIAVR
ncbi:MAG TPA: serine/threonine-protein kinase [Planctomycetota bacterium]|nr:serine/threonine-protein kinase [Planctomycetota bacterium]